MLLAVSIVIVAVASAALCILEYFLTGIRWPIGLFLPIATMVLAAIFDTRLLWLTAALLIVFICAVFVREKQRIKKS